MKISFVSCAKRFNTQKGPVDALRGVDLEVEEGEFFVLLGPSGCGKSTLLNLTAGLEKLSRGEIRFDDRVVDCPERKIYVPPMERNIAMVFQSYALYPHLNVFKNISFPLEVSGEQKAKRRGAVIAVAELLNISSLLDRKPGELSGGQRQRVAIARALVRRPSAFLLDEPLSNLDVQLRAETRAELKQLQRKLSITTLYVTHDQTEAMTLGDRIALLREGVPVQIGSPMEMYTAPRTPFAGSFIGTPPMNLFRAEIKWENGKAALASGGTRFSLPVEKEKVIEKIRSGEVLVGIRPEHLRVQASQGEGILEGVVKLVEPLGREDLLHIETPFGEFLALNSREEFRAGQKVTLFFEEDRVHFFEVESDSNI
jgi:multiple sugar transport system ATP-binding protein